MAAPTYTPLPTAPARTMTPTAFAAAADAFVAALAAFQTEGDTLGAYTQTQAEAALAAAIAGNLSGLDLTALAGWVIGVNNAGDALEGVELVPPSNATTTAAGIVEKATTAEAQGGTTGDKFMDDVLTKAAITAQVHQTLEMSMTVATGVAPAASAALTWNVRPINTVEVNEISGASLSANLITLPAGTYDVNIAMQCADDDSILGASRLWCTTDSASVLRGLNYGFASTYARTTMTTIQGRLVVASAKAYRIEQYTHTAGGGGTGLGYPSSEGTVDEVYMQATFRKVG